MTMTETESPVVSATAMEPFYLIDQDGAALDHPRFASEDDAYDFVVQTYGEDAWNVTAILASDEEEEA